jgi:hypothetical protein
MDEPEITYEDLLDDDDPAESLAPKTLSDLLADGFPRRGTLETLAAIVRLDDPAASFGAVQRGYQELLDKQLRAPRR